LVVLRDSNQEDDSSDIFKAVDPLLSLGTLTTDVKETVVEVTDVEAGFSDTGGLDTGSQDVLVGREVVWGGDTVDGLKVAVIFGRKQRQ
jgi:hypothetical protein